MERGYYEPAPPVRESILKVVRELWPRWIGESAGIYTPTSAVVVVKWGDLELMKVACEGRLPSIEGVVACCVDASLEAVLDDNLLSRPATPARYPGWEMVRQLEPANVHELWHGVRQPVLEPSIMVAKRPD